MMRVRLSNVVASALVGCALCCSVVGQRTAGNVTSLTRQGEDTTNASGQTLRRVVDTSGAIIELTLDQAGRVVNSRVVSQATGTGRP